MSKHLFSPIENNEDYFNSKLYFKLNSYINSDTENLIEETEQKSYIQNLNNENENLEEYLLKDLIETIDSIDSINPENEIKKEENIKNNFNLDETNDSSILFNSFEKSGSIDEEIIQNEKNKDIISLVENHYIFIPKSYYLKKQRTKKFIEERPGDWICFYCQNLNFAFRNICNRCGVLKEKSESEKYKIN